MFFYLEEKSLVFDNSGFQLEVVLTHVVHGNYGSEGSGVCVCVCVCVCVLDKNGRIKGGVTEVEREVALRLRYIGEVYVL